MVSSTQELGFNKYPINRTIFRVIYCDWIVPSLRARLSIVLIGLPYYLIIWAVILEVSRVLVASETLSMDTRVAWHVEFYLSTHKLVSLTITRIVAKLVA